MDIQQQTKNVAAQGRFGDSMLLHVNPAEVKGLASAVPLTINPETGQPEAFLPFLAPVLGSMLAPTVLGAIGVTGLSAGAMAGIGAGLATYAQTGGSGSKALLSGLTAGLGTRALQGVAQGTQAGVDAAIATPPVDPSFVGPMPTPVAPVTPPVAPPLDKSITAGESLKSMFTQPDLAGQMGGFDAGMKSLAGAAMTPAGMAAGTAAGTAGVIASQEEFERQMAQLTEDEEERKRRMYEMYPEQIPMKEGGRTGYFMGGMMEDKFVPDAPYGYESDYSGLNGIGGGFNAYSTPPRRRTRPIGRGFMPGFMPEYSYFENMNPSATALGYDPLGNFQNPQSYQGGYSQPSRRRGGFGGLLGGSRRGYRPQPQLQPPQFAGYGNPFMQSPSYQGFYGVPQMQQTLNPYARFTQQPMPYQPYQPYVPPVETPPDDGGGTGGGGTGGGGTPPIDPPIDDGGGRKGAVKNPDPIAPPDDFVNPIINPPVGGPVEPPVYYPGGTPGFYDRPVPKPVKPIIEPINTPPPTVTIPIEGGADVTIPDFSRPQPPAPVIPPVMAPPMKRPEPPMSIDRISNYDLDRKFGAVPISEPAPTDDMARLSPAQLASIGTPLSQSALDQQAAMSSLQANSIDNLLKGPKMSNDSDRFNRDRIAIANPIALPPIAPPVQSVTTPQPFLQQPKAPQTGGIPVTGGGPLGSGILPEANLPAGTPPLTGPAQGERQIPSGPAMGGISAVPTPAAPANQKGNNPPTMSIGGPGGGRRGIFGAPMFAAGGDTDLPNEGLEALSKTEKGREAVEAMGYQEGGQTDMMQDPVTQDVIMFILGETDNENAINAFVEKYGAEQFMFLRDKILKQAAGNPDAQTEGLIQGNGNSGMADDLPGVIGNKEKIAVSQDEFIVPADVVSMLGDGSSDAGSKQLYNMMDRVRQAKTGGTTQAPPLNPQKVLPA
tara:strand:- start:303 stop:3125 length:2823 start_codon:yes stop_codon:yes gene_type:complete